MRKLQKKYTFLLLFFNFLIVNAQISTGLGGSSSVLPNSLTTNTNVGIGTNKPIAKLEITGSLPDGQTFTNSQDRNDKCAIFSGGSIVNTSISSRMVNFYDFPASNIDPKSMFWFSIDDRSDNQRFRVYAQTGGFGTLVLNDKTQSEYFKVYEDGTGKVYQQMGKPDSKLIIGGYSDYVPGLSHKLVVQNGSALIEGNIVTGANIGIGTSNFTDGADTYRLSVKGKVRAEEVKVYNTWADYVFHPNYALPSLTEVENYIAKNGHLKNVPSAKEITQNGLELGEMAKIQQEKIEELTLYLIQQNKEIEELKAQMKLLLTKK